MTVIQQPPNPLQLQAVSASMFSRTLRLAGSHSCQGDVEDSPPPDIQAVTSGVLQILFAVSRSGGGTVMVLVLTQLMGLYAISSIVLIRKQLPMKYR